MNFRKYRLVNIKTVKAMNSFKTVSIGLVVTILSFASCSKELEVQEPLLSMEEISACFGKTDRTIAELQQTLLGEWRWQSQSCSPGRTNSGEESVYSVYFRKDGHMYFYKGNEILQNSPYSIEKGADGYFSVITDRDNEFLSGHVMICDRNLVFSNKYLEAGCDNFYSKLGN